MNLTDQDIREFISAWEEEYSELLNMEEARLHASLLLKLYMHLAEHYSYPSNLPGTHEVL